MKILVNQNGFSYVLALTVVMIMGIMLGMVGQSWKTIKQRELEEEIIFRGDQVAELVYQKSLCSNPTVNQAAVNQAAVNQAAVNQTAVNQTSSNQTLWPVNSPNGTILDDLLIGKEERCANGTTRKFRLRSSAVLDPLSNKQWRIITPVGDLAHFSGVASDSKEEPFRKSFKSIYDSNLLDGKKTYSEWLFTWELKLPQNQIQ